MNTSIVWYRTDLRVEDHRSMMQAVLRSDFVLPVFIYDQSHSSLNSANRLQFMIECIEDLRDELHDRGSRLIIRKGDPAVVLAALARQTGSSAVYWGRHYEPREVESDAKVKAALEANGIQCITQKENVLFESSEIRTADDRPYTVFTPYRKKALTRLDLIPKPAAAPRDLKTPSFISSLQSEPIDQFKPEPNRLASGRQLGGSKKANHLWQDFLKNGISVYSEKRDQLSASGTSRMSAHIKFGSISIRRIYHDLSSRESSDVFLNEILWREFYSNILQSFPLVANSAFQKHFAALEWSNDEVAFERWQAGLTGFPVVDAAMRELLETGHMHNRARMIVASFLTKDLRINWQWGEQHFMEHLTDGDLAQNNGGWQWAASTGTDAQPYYRIFNPYLQSKKFDANGDYIRRFVPELENLPANLIHEPNLLTEEQQRTYGISLDLDYPRPIVDHATAREKAKEMYASARTKHG
jgi:deoxyribodipyrimidine photo-lyase